MRTAHAANCLCSSALAQAHVKTMAASAVDPDTVIGRSMPHWETRALRGRVLARHATLR
jgi:hypothetical protein